jgi:hypothetical protein
VTNAYIEGIRNGDMGDHGVITMLCRRYGIKAYVWNAPSLEALDAGGTRSRVFRCYEVSPAVPGNRPCTLYLLHTNLGVEHFEPVMPIEGTTARPSRFTAVGNRQESDTWCPILNIQYTSNAARRRVRFQLSSSCFSTPGIVVNGNNC